MNTLDLKSISLPKEKDREKEFSTITEVVSGY